MENAGNDFTIFVCGGAKNSPLFSQLSLGKSNSDFTKISSAISQSLLTQPSLFEGKESNVQCNVKCTDKSVGQETNEVSLQNYATQNRSLRDQISQLRLEKEALQRQSLENSLKESQQELEKFLSVLSINPDNIKLTETKIESGAFADVLVANWRGMKVAVKKYHGLITNTRNVAMFQREVLVRSRLHHPNIVTVCGAVIKEGYPFQMVMEMLEGSISEAINAAHASSLGYLRNYEQISISIGITSAIAYVHQLQSYIHGDIRTSNILLTRDMKVKVGDWESAHLLNASLSASPLSRHYVAPERMLCADGSAGHSSLVSDVYCLGVTLIEIFTGLASIREERKTQSRKIVDRPRLYNLCCQMIADDVATRPSAEVCLNDLIAEETALKETKELRLVTGKFEGNKHKVVLSDFFMPAF